MMAPSPQTSAAQKPRVPWEVRPKSRAGVFEPIVIRSMNLGSKSPAYLSGLHVKIPVHYQNQVHMDPPQILDLTSCHVPSTNRG